MFSLSYPCANAHFSNASRISSSFNVSVMHTPYQSNIRNPLAKCGIYHFHEKFHLLPMGYLPLHLAMQVELHSCGKVLRKTDIHLDRLDGLGRSSSCTLG